MRFYSEIIIVTQSQQGFTGQFQRAMDQNIDFLGLSVRKEKKGIQHLFGAKISIIQLKKRRESNVI